MNKSGRIIELIKPNDLILVASSFRDPINWTEVCIVSEEIIYRTLSLKEGSKVVSQCLIEFISQEQRPLGIFRQNNSSINLAQELEKDCYESKTKLFKFIDLFIGKSFNWNNSSSTVKFITDKFKASNVKDLEQTKSLIRIL